MIILALLLVLLGCPAWAKAPELDDILFDQRPGASIPENAVLHREDGSPTSLRAAIGDRPTVLALGYFHCPTLCGIVRDDLLNGLAESGLRAGPDYTLLVVSIDPGETVADAAAARAGESARYPLPGEASGTHYLTGDATPIEQAVGFKARFEAETKQFLHPAGLVFLTPSGQVSGYLMGVGYKPGDLRAGITRAGAGSVEKAALPVLLLCFHFDPQTGRYTLAVMRLLQIGGVLTVLTVTGTIVLAMKRERR